MLTVVVVILPPSKSLDALPRPFRSQDLALLRDEYREQSNIKQSLLERLNKFSRGNSQKLVILRPNNRYQDFSPIANEKHQRGLIFGDQYYISNIEPNYRTTSITSEVSNPTAMNPKISQKSGEDEWKQIRQRRLRYYKVGYNF